MSWRVILAIGLAFVVGAGAGALVEHQRVKDDKTATAAPTTTTTVPAADWFGSNQASACPALKKVQTAAIAGYTALAQAKDWPTTRAEIVKQVAAGTAGFQQLVTLANATGKPELQFLLSHQGQLSSAASQSSSRKAYLATQTAQTTPRVTADLAAVAQAVKGCS